MLGIDQQSTHFCSDVTRLGEAWIMPQTPRHERGSMNGNQNSGNGKKKYGRNNHANNKFSKAAPAPMSSDRADRNANNGLLLLSTKKTSSSMLASKNATISSGVGTTMNLHHQACTSTHQALLSAVAGTQQVGPQEKPDAWGTAESGRREKVNNTSTKEQYEQVVEYHDHGPEEISHQESPENGASWDEYGGRGRSSSTSEATSKEARVGDQVAYMSRLAQERAKIKSQEEEVRVLEQKNKAAQRLQELERKRGGKSNSSNETKDRSKGGRTLWEPDKNNNQQQNNHVNITAKGTPDSLEGDGTIHLASYDDRNRGERGASTAPRMLYDPKSAKMVEVKGKLENSGNNNKNRKERNNRSKNKKEREAKPEIVLKKGRNNQKVKRDMQLAKKPTPPEKKRANPNRKHPRTCGVQYKRDKKGNLQSADQCDGDLGYGAHSVPGGKVQNSEAYNSWFEREAVYGENSAYGLEGLEGTTLNYGLGGENNYPGENASGDQAEDYQSTLEWIKADDKLELVTGVDDSPTLKPTAKEFAPSQIPSSAVAATGNESSDDNSMLIGKEAQEEEDSEAAEEESYENVDGLGFDPLQGIDFMNSPNHAKSPDEIATAGLSSLSLAPTMFSGAQAGDASETISRPFFSFGTSDTWGQNSNTEQSGTAGLSGWGSQPMSTGLFGSDMFLHAPEQERESAAFLGGGASNSWGQSGIPGLDSLPAINADQGSAPAD